MDRENISEKRCGTCLYHRYVSHFADWTCINSNSEHWTDLTEYSNSCEEWRKERKKTQNDIRNLCKS